MGRFGIVLDLARAGAGAGLRYLASVVDPSGEVLYRARRAAVEDDAEPPTDPRGSVGPPPVVSPEARVMLAGQVNIRQSFEDADPEKIVEVFERDLRRAGRRVVAGYPWAKD